MKIIIVSLSLLMTATLAAQNPEPAADTIVVGRQTKGVMVTGKIMDAATRKAAAGVRVEVQNYSAAITEADGQFSLRVPSYHATLIVSGEGYDTREVPLKGRHVLNIFLLDDTHASFHDPVTMPFGPQPKKQVTASVSQYNATNWTQNAEIPDALLQGRIAGLNAIRRSGTQGAGANLFLRGYNSLYATNKPLIIVDNMLYDANDYGQSIIANNYTNPLALIDAKDIDNITVLRDASSIYGTKGANGAIIITTARAKEQATKIDFGVFTGFNQAPKNLPVMDAADYRIYLSEMLQSKGMSSSEIAAQPFMNDDPAGPLYYAYHNNTDWQKKVLDNSLTNNVFLKVTGGDNIARYGLSMGYMKNEASIRSTDFSRYSTRFNAEFNFTKKFTGYTNLSATYNEQNLKDLGISDKTSPLYLALTKAPFLNDHDVNEKGIQSPNLAGVDILGIGNPAAVIEQMQAYNKYYRFTGSFGFKYDIDAHWNASTMFGVLFDKVRENIFVPSIGISKDTLSNAVANNRLGTQVKRLFAIYNDTRIEYKKNIRNTHAIAARLGLRYQQNNAEQDYSLGFNSATDELVSVQNGLPALRQVGGGIGEWKWLNTYINADYAYKDKFFVSFNMAMDGSSRFGKQATNGITIAGNQMPMMPSVSAAWLLSAEDWMARSVMDLLKLRATYSISGNDDIGNYTSRQTYGSQNLLGMQGLVRNGIANPALQWETSRKTNLGLDAACWNERVSLSIDLFQSKTDNMLVYEDLPTTSGFKTILTNNGSMKNSGIELTLNTRVINTPALKWDAGIILSTYKNKIAVVPNGQFTTPYAGATLLTAVGQPANLFYGYASNGVFATDAEAAAAKAYIRNSVGDLVPFKGGDVRFTNLVNNAGDTLPGNIKVNVIDASDRQVIGDPNPSFTGGFSNRISYKRFELNVLFTFSQGNDVFNYTRYRLESLSGVENQLESAKNRWRGNGQITTTPKATWGDPMGNSRFSDRWIEDGSYLRLRSISLQYNIPLSNWLVQYATVYAIGSNLFTLTKYKGYDPEFSSSASVFAQGIDTGLEPIFKNITLGVRIGL